MSALTIVNPSCWSQILWRTIAFGGLFGSANDLTALPFAVALSDTSLKTNAVEHEDQPRSGRKRIMDRISRRPYLSWKTTPYMWYRQKIMEMLVNATNNKVIDWWFMIISLSGEGFQFLEIAIVEVHRNNSLMYFFCALFLNIEWVFCNYLQYTTSIGANFIRLIEIRKHMGSMCFVLALPIPPGHSTAW